jgi:hypothetical protein
VAEFKAQSDPAKRELAGGASAFAKAPSDFGQFMPDLPVDKKCRRRVELVFLLA